MPFLEQITGHPFCVPADYVTGDGANMALWNEFAESVKFELNTGIQCVQNYGRYMPFGGANTVYPTVIGQTGNQFSTAGNPNTFRVVFSQEYGFEMMPGWEQFKFMAPVHLPIVNYSYYIAGYPVTQRKLLSLRLKVTNINTNVTETIGHFFADENEVNTWCAGQGVPSHGTPAQYVQTIGVNEIFLNYAVDIPTTLQPLGQWSDIARLTVEVLIPPIPVSYLVQIGQSYPNFTGVQSFNFKQVMQCQ